MNALARKLGGSLLLAAVLTLTLVLLASPALASGGLAPIFPNPVSPNGQRIYQLYEIISIPAIVVFVGVEGALLYIILKFRRKSSDQVGAAWHSNTRLEIAWTVIPILVVAVISYLSFLELQRDFLVDGTTIASAQGPTDLNLTVTAYQFGWDYDYPQGFTLHQPGNPSGAVEPLVVPVGKLVRMRLQTRDVIHSWWVPALTGKTDAVPGYDNYTWFRIGQSGEWAGECAELCGVGHYTMIIKVKAVPEAEFNQWVADQLRKSRGATGSSSQSTPSPSPSTSPAP